MARTQSRVAAGWWDFTTLSVELLADASRLDVRDLVQLSRPGFEVKVIATIEEFYLAQALEYVEAWRGSTPDNPCGICGPIGPTEQLPLVARIVNSLDLNLAKREAHFWAMDEWVDDRGQAVGTDHPLSFARADMELCFNRIRPELRPPSPNLHFPTGDLVRYSASYDGVRCKVMQGGQGEAKHWAFNDPPRREGDWSENPPPPAEYRKLSTRVADLHPLTVIQNARTSSGGQAATVPTRAITVGPVETWKADRVSIWHAGVHDNPFGMRLTALMIAKRIVDTSVPMSLLAEHPDVTFTYYLPALSTCQTRMR